MPNGRSGGFVIARDRLEGLLRGVPSDTVVGKTLEEPITAGDLVRLLAMPGKDQIPIEEQDHGWYIIHLPTWITVNNSSAMHGGLRQCHEQWLKEPPPVADISAGADAATFAFPDLQRQSTLFLTEAAFVALFGGGLLMAAGRVAPGYRRLGLVLVVLGFCAFVPLAWFVAHGAWLGISNAAARARWSRRFPSRLSSRQLRSVLAADPGRFVVHMRLFGGFDATRPCPVAVLEDRSTGDLAAVHPPSWYVREICEALQVQVIEHW